MLLGFEERRLLGCDARMLLGCDAGMLCIWCIGFEERMTATAVEQRMFNI